MMILDMILHMKDRHQENPDHVIHSELNLCCVIYLKTPNFFQT